MEPLVVLAVLWLLCMAVMAPMMLLWRGRWMPGRFMYGRFGSEEPPPPETARQILDRRYASGEITEERYQAMRAELDGPATPDRADRHGSSFGTLARLFQESRRRRT